MERAAANARFMSRFAATDARMPDAGFESSPSTQRAIQSIRGRWSTPLRACASCRRQWTRVRASNPVSDTARKNIGPVSRSRERPIRGSSGSQTGSLSAKRVRRRVVFRSSVSPFRNCFAATDAGRRRWTPGFSLNEQYNALALKKELTARYVGFKHGHNRLTRVE